MGPDGDHGAEGHGEAEEKKEGHRRVTRKLRNSAPRHREISYLQLRALRFLADEK